MNTEIAWVFEAALKPDAQDEVKSLVLRISDEDQAAEPDTRIFECFTDGHELHFYERFKDSASAEFHLKRFGENYAGPLLSICTPTRVTVYGEPSDGVRAAMDPFGPRYLPAIAGFVRD